MPAPKLQRILDTLGERLAAILITGGYYTDIGARVPRDRRPPEAPELPACLLYLGERAAEETQQERTKCTQSVTVEAFVDLGEADAETIGIQLLADVQRAMELPDDTSLGGELLSVRYGLTWESEEIYMPEMGANVVGVRVIYAMPHIRKLGDPEIA